MDGVEIVVDRDAADTHCVGHILDSAPQDERTALVEQTNGTLLALARQHWQRVTQLGLDGVDQPLQRTVQRRQPDGGDCDALPDQRDIAGFGIVSVDE